MNVGIENSVMSLPKISICIATLNRPREVLEVLDVIGKFPDYSRFETIVIDSSNTKNIELEDTVREFGGKYVWTGIACGIDQDYDSAIRNSSGDYCWLVADDDRLLVESAARILDAAESIPDLVLINASVHNLDYSKTLSDTLIGEMPGESQILNAGLEELSRFSALLTYIGSVVIRRDLWVRSKPEQFFGTEFVHVGVILSSLPLSHIQVIRDPLIQIRYGQAHWKMRYAQIWWKNWERLICSFGIDEEDFHRWGISHGKKRLINIFLAKALGAVTRDDIRQRTQTYSKLVARLIRVTTFLSPKYVLRPIFIALFTLLGRKKYAVVLTDLRSLTSESLKFK
jgi:glycosyltransferase involved in cell wall biosynthesis